MGIESFRYDGKNALVMGGAENEGADCFFPLLQPGIRMNPQAE